MTRDTIIKLAREAGFTEGDISLFPDLIVHFATLVAAAERERCIEACEASYHLINGPEGWLQYAVEAIRARGETK